MPFNPSKPVPQQSDKQAGVDPIAPQFDILQEAVEELRDASLVVEEDLDFVPVDRAVGVEEVAIDPDGNGSFLLDFGLAQSIFCKVLNYNLVGVGTSSSNGTAPPTISNFSTTPTSGNAPLIVTVAATVVASAPATIATVFVDWGDTIVEAVTLPAQHGYTEPGTYSVTLTVTDSDGQVRTASSSVVVSAPPAAQSGTDDFQRANTSTTDAAPLGPNWTARPRSVNGEKLYISNGQATASASAGENAADEIEIAYQDWGSPYGTVTVVGAVAHPGGTGMGFTLELTDENNFVIATPSVGDGFYLARVSGGTRTPLTRIPASGITATSTSSVVLSDGGGGTVNCQFRVDGANVGSPYTLTGVTPATKHGLAGTKGPVAAESFSFTPAA